MATTNIPGRANIVNFIRFDHGMTTVEGEMREVLKHGLPATWLLQYDALVAGPYVEYLKGQVAANHEIGLWFEVNQRHCLDAGVRFRGEVPEPSNTFNTENWDHHSQAMMPCGYTQEERIRLIDTMMRKFFSIYGRFPMSVAGWYIDSFSLNYLWEKYHICASANCKDQWGTDGYTVWGAPYHAFYYPSKCHAMMAAGSRDTQIGVPVFRMLGNDPVNAHHAILETNGQPVYTLEPAFPNQGGGNPEWVRRYFDLMLDPTTRPFAYFQVGQENSFSWEGMKKGYAFQLDELIRRRDQGQLVVETMGATGQFVQRHFSETPVGMLDARDNLLSRPTRAIWYHSKNYRAQALYSDRRFEIVDLYRYACGQEEPYYHRPVRTWNAIVTAMPVIDSFLFGSRWVLAGRMADGKPFDEREVPILDVRAEPAGETLVVTYRNGIGISSRISFGPDSIRAERRAESSADFQEILSFDPQLRYNPVQGTYFNNVVFGWDNYDYRIAVKETLPCYQRDQARVLLGTVSGQPEIATTLFMYPCVT